MSRAAELAKFIGDGTLGLGGAEDKKLVFDGNAQDFHIGLDDSADSLTIGLGSTLGTTSHMVFDANGHITKPLQSAFLVTKSGSQDNLSINQFTTVTFDTEVFDQNGDFASNAFTAPVTGRYQLNVHCYVQNMDTASNYVQVDLNTSNRVYYNIVEPDYNSDQDYFVFIISMLADMDASDTANVRVYLDNSGSAQMDVRPQTFFSGYLVA